jgi:hypothetical protein
LSKALGDSPCILVFAGMQLEATYTPGEAVTGLFGGNSNWRGPIWIPVNFLLIDSLRKFHAYFGSDYRVECPVGSGIMLDLDDVADELSKRLQRLFLKDTKGQRSSVNSGATIDDNLLFYEYFHGDTGEGLGASHQTGWTGLIANLLYDRGIPATGTRL